MVLLLGGWLGYCLFGLWMKISTPLILGLSDQQQIVRPSVCCCLVGRYVEFLCGDIFGMINKLFLLLWIYYSIFHINKNNPKILKLFCFFSLSIAILSKMHLSSSMWKFLRKISLEKIFASFDEAIYSHRT